MDVIPSEATVPHDATRPGRLNILHERLKRRFFTFVAVWAAKVLLFAFGIGVVTPFDREIYRLWLLAHNAALVGMLLAFGLFADTAIRTAHALGKDRAPYWAYFALLPLFVLGFPYLGPIPFGFWIYNSVLGSPYVVYRVLGHELEEEAQRLMGYGS
jgi:hypothetical protein